MPKSSQKSASRVAATVMVSVRLTRRWLADYYRASIGLLPAPAVFFPAGVLPLAPPRFALPRAGAVAGWTL
jgi:hypothetical protein